MRSAVWQAFVDATPRAVADACLPILCSVLAACGPKIPAEVRSEPELGGTSAATHQELTQQLTSLLRELHASHGLQRVKAIAARVAPKLETDLTLPDVAEVDLLEVQKGGALLLAFLRFRPEHYDRCSEGGPSPTIGVLALAPTDGGETLRFSDDFSAGDVQFFDANDVRVVFPTTQAPVFEVHYRPDEPCDPFTPSGERVEAFHLPSRTRLLASFPLSTTFDGAGNRDETYSTLAWLPSKSLAGGVLMVTSRLDTGTIFPCTDGPYDPTSPSCLPQVSCNLTSDAILVGAAGQDDSVDWDALQKSEPALRRLVASGSGESRSACDQLQP